ncbi:hypothetical protein Q1695_005042 [Nippostrongylus brasiliensis]|nr:hypothetical protein Q1695_005042 [Nippostrongylus brasiliensis]
MTDLRLKLQDLRYELDDAKFEIRNLRSQLEEAKAENEKFRHAIPKLPTPERLHEMIVAQYQEFYRCTKRIAHLDANIRRTRNSKRSWETRMQELKQHELAHEKTRLEFLLVRAQLRTLMATPALLFCMNSISEEVWEAWMETPQKNDDGKPLLQNYGAIENAITDQLQLLEEYRSNLQTLRAELEGEQQKNTFSFQDEVLEGIKKLQSSMEKTAPEFDFTSLRRILEEQEQKNSIPRQEFMKAVEEIQHCIREALQNAADIHQPKPKQEEMPGLVDDDIINDNIEFMEELDDLEMVDESADEPAQQRNNDLRQQLQDQLQQARQGRNDLVQIIADLRNQKTCQPRRFERGFINKAIERTMRCAFCSAIGSHYSDSCTEVKSTQERRRLIEGQRKCTMCLEYCIGGERCAKYRTKCFHCREYYHHSALCELPEHSEEIIRQLVEAQDRKEAYEEQITELERNLRALG